MDQDRVIRQLSQLRLERNWSYERLAAEICRLRPTAYTTLAGNTVRRLIIGQHRPSARLLFALERYLAAQKPTRKTA